jgi:hypothetical protein
MYGQQPQWVDREIVLHSLEASRTKMVKPMSPGVAFAMLRTHVRVSDMVGVHRCIDNNHYDHHDSWMAGN